MVMRYHEHPFHGVGTNGYLWQGENSSQWVFADFQNSSYMWNSMPEDYFDIFDIEHNLLLNNEQIFELAQISYHSGVACMMEYGLNSSGALPEDQYDALIEHFKFSPAAQFLDRSDYSNDDWLVNLKNEINNHRIVPYTGFNFWHTSGHAFVCDGYDEQDYFHFVWGWGLQWPIIDGFYALNSITPGVGINYSYDQKGVFYLEPENSIYSSTPQLSNESCFPNQALHYSVSFGEIFQGSSYQAFGYEFEVNVKNGSGQVVYSALGSEDGSTGNYNLFFSAPQNTGNYSVIGKFNTVHKTINETINTTEPISFTVNTEEYTYQHSLTPESHQYQPGTLIQYEIDISQAGGNPATGLSVVYGLRLKNGPQFESYVCAESPGGSGHYIANLSAPNEADDYEIYAMIIDGGQPIFSTTPIDFEVFVDPPGVPVLVYPENDQEGVSVTPSFFWEPVEDAESYDFGMYDWVNGYLQQIYYKSGLTGTDFIPDDFTFEYDEHYDWTVRARANGEIGDWATLFEFETEYYLDEPELLSPANNSVNISLTPLFIWENIPDADYYRIEVTTDPEMDDEVASFNNITDNYFNLPFEILEISTDYYWTVKAYATGGTYDWSNPTIFTTGGELPPGNPTLLFPLDVATSQSLTPTFEWESGDGVSLSYKIEISEIFDFSTILFSNDQIEQSSYVLPPSTLAISTTYYWRIYGWNDSGLGEASQIQSFSTTSSSGGPGSIIWSKQVNDIIEDQPVFDKYGFLWVNYDGNLVKLNPVNGETVLTIEGFGWQTNNKSPTISHDGLTIYTIASDNAPLIQLDTGNDIVAAADLDGNLLWYYDTWHGAVHKPVMDASGNLYLACEGGYEQYNHENSIISLNGDGEYRWRNLIYDDSYDFQSHPVVSGNLVYISRDGNGNLDATFFALNTNNGQTVLSLNYGNKNIAMQSPSLTDNRIYFEDQSDDLLRCYSKSNGNGISGWPKVGLDNFKATTVIDDQGVAFNGTADEDGMAYVYAFNPNGSIKWQKDITDDYGDAAVLGNDDVLYFGSRTNVLYAVNKETGVTLWTINLQARVRGITIGPNGTLYVCTNNIPGSEGMYAIETTATGIADSPWPTDNHDLQGTCCYEHQELSPIPSVISMLINNDVAITQNQQVTLNNTAIYSPTHYMASEDQYFVSVSWQTYFEGPAFTLSDGSGQKTVYFKVKNDEGESSVLSDQIYYESGLPFINEFEINNGDEFTSSTQVTLDNSAGNNPTHYIASENVDFSNSSWQTYSESPIDNLSEGIGQKTVYFKVKNEIGESEVVLDQIELILPEIDADFEADERQVQATHTVNFTDLSTGTPTTWQWDFGDGTTSDEESPSHEYTAPGLYSVSLTVFDGENEDTELKEDYIEVLPNPAQTDVINLLEGWNLISFDVIIEENEPADVFAELIGNNQLEYVTGYNQGAGQYFDPNGLPFLNTLSEVMPCLGHWVKVNEDCSLTAEGASYAVNNPCCDLLEGWNLISYWPEENMSPEMAFGALTNAGKLLMITGFENGAGKYYDPNGLPFLNTLTELKNSFGYWVLLSEEVECFSYPSSDWNCGDLLLDNRDGQEYETVLIGEQCWMATNLNIGVRIYSNVNMSDNGVIEKFCYENHGEACDTLGGLYQWDELMQYTTIEGTVGICQDGWHVPTSNEFCALSQYLDPTVDCSSSSTWIGSNVGGKLKYSGTKYWNDPNLGATNESGFSAIGAGICHADGYFFDIGKNNYLRTSTEYEPPSQVAWYWRLGYTESRILSSGTSKGHGMSVRCIKD